MTRSETRDGALVVTQGTWLYVSMGSFFAGLALVTMSVVVIKGDISVVPAAFIEGIVGGFLMTRPIRRVSTLRPGAPAMFEVRTLFGTRRREAEDVTGVSLVIGTYRAYVSLRSRESPPETILTKSKTWTWERDNTPARQYAEEIARFLGLQLG